MISGGCAVEGHRERRKGGPVVGPHMGDTAFPRRSIRERRHMHRKRGASVASCIDTTTTAAAAITGRNHQKAPSLPPALTTTRCYPPSVSPHRRLRKNLLRVSPLPSLAGASFYLSRSALAFILRDFHHLRLGSFLLAPRRGAPLLSSSFNARSRSEGEHGSSARTGPRGLLASCCCCCCCWLIPADR